jgi:hypothetical protein
VVVVVDVDGFTYIISLIKTRKKRKLTIGPNDASRLGPLSSLGWWDASSDVWVGVWC